MATQRGRTGLTDYTEPRGGQASTSSASINLGTTRNRTELFFKYRRQATSNLRPFADAPGTKDTSIETARLMASALGTSSDAAEAGLGGTAAADRPQYVDFKEQVRTDMLAIRDTMAELKSLHGKAALSKFDDTKDEEVEVEVLTQQITKMFRKCESRLQQFGQQKGPSQEDEKVKRNVQRTLAVELQRLSLDFRKQQKQYLNRLRGKELSSSSGAAGNDHRSTTNLLDLTTSDNTTGTGYNNALDDEFDPGFSGMQSVKVNTISALVHERDREVVKIVSSINELAQIMKDLSVLVIDQGTILDRIDYNLESTAATVEQGVRQLHRAERAQRRGIAATCVLILLVAVVFLIVFIVLKTMLTSL